MKNFDAVNHLKGKSIYIDDYNLPTGTLHAAIFVSEIAHGKIKKINYEKAKQLEGVISIITYKDIPGENQIGGIIQDETLLAENEVEYIGEPIAIIVAKTKEIAKHAKTLIEIEYEKLEAIVDEREAYKKGSLITAPVIFANGNLEKSFNDAGIIVEGRFDSAGQEHLYLETQGAIAIPIEGNKFKIISSTQNPTAVQKQASKVLGCSMNKLEVDVLRLGGAFGGKEDQATPWAVMAALASLITNTPIKLVLSREDDLRMTGKRHPYSSDYKLGLDKNGKFLAFEVTYFQNAGAVADLSTAVLERTLFHATNSYFIPNVKATGISCKTNLPPNTAFRGFGGPQGMLVIEAAIEKAAQKMGIPTSELQRKNLIIDGNYFHYGQVAENVNAIKSWKEAEEKFNYPEIVQSVTDFNLQNTRYKKGISVMPICFGISFTSTFLNQASALVHIYNDGSIGVSTAAVEMGQGVNAKIAIAAAKVFSVNVERVKVETTNTTRIANTSPTAASSAVDMNGNATILASKKILNRLFAFIRSELNLNGNDSVEIQNEIVFVNGKATELKWDELIWKTYFNRISLSAQAFYATPNIHFDRKVNKGKPFAYHVYGTAITVAKLDVLLGIYEIEYVKLVHDFGETLNHEIDLGQVEGALVQGIGWLTLEELKYSEEGKLLSNSLSAYKVPDIYSAPKSIEVEYLENSKNPLGPFNSKAIGEPPLMYGIGAFFAIKNAILNANPNADFEISSPITPEKVLLSLHNQLN